MNRTTATDAHDFARRRSSMRNELIVAMRQVHARRRRRKRNAALCALTLAMSSLAILAISNRSGSIERRALGPTESHKQASPVLGDSSSPSTPAAARIQIVQTDSTIVQRYAAETSRQSIQIINDQELLETLESINRPTGLVRIGDRILLTAAVTDRERTDAQHRRRPSS